MTTTYTHHDGAPQTPSAPTASAVRAAPAALAPRDNPIFAVAARAAALRAQGIDVITLAAGEADTPTAAGVVHAAQRAAADPALHHYGPAAGLPCLREAIAHATAAPASPPTSSRCRSPSAPSTPCSRPSRGSPPRATQVLVVTPGWPGHTEVVTAARATPVQVATTSATGFQLAPELLDRRRCPRTRALILANPGNPTGRAAQRARPARHRRLVRGRQRPPGRRRGVLPTHLRPGPCPGGGGRARAPSRTSLPSARSPRPTP